MEVKYTKTNSRKKNRKKRKKSKAPIILLLLLVLVVTAVVLLNTVLFPIEKITIKGETIYKAEEILNASAINKGDKLFSISQSKTKELLTTKLPFIKDVKLDKKLPNEIIITVTPDVEKFSISHNNRYVIVTENYKFLEQKAKAKKGTIIVKGVELVPNEIGKEIAFKNEDKKEAFLNIINYLTKYNLTVTGVDVTNLAQLKATVNSGIEVNFGTSKDIDYKIQYLKAALKTIKEDAKGSMDFSGWTTSNPKGYFTNLEN